MSRVPPTQTARTSAPRTLVPTVVALAATVAAGLAVPLALTPAPAAAQETVPTILVVRAVANDAKVIGTSVGGARITVRHAETGEVLAEGVQEGGTGNTGAIMGTRERGATVYDHEGTAAFTATLALERPTPVVVEAAGPLGTPHAEQTASASLLLVPGEHVDGEGLALVLHGFTVLLTEPAVGADPLPAGAVAVRADVSMLCGCPIESGGMWDADRITVTAALLQDGKVMVEAPLPWAGVTNIFAGSVAAPGPGSYVLRVTAVDADRANAGMATREIVVGAR